MCRGGRVLSPPEFDKSMGEGYTIDYIENLEREVVYNLILSL